jgi:hypothetical protein
VTTRTTKVIFQLAKAPDYRFPDVEYAGPEGLLAVGGDLDTERVLAAYRQGTPMTNRFSGGRLIPARFYYREI